MNSADVCSVRLPPNVPLMSSAGIRILCIALALAPLLSLPAHADCPAVPIASSDDMVISFLAGQGGTQAAPSTHFSAPVKKGMLVYDATNDALKICNGTAWQTISVGTGGGALAALSDVTITSPSTGQTLVYNSGTGKRVNGAAGATPAGTVAGAVQFRGSTAVLAADDANFVWDNTNKRLGIGTAAPVSILDIRGGSGAVNANIATTGSNTDAFLTLANGNGNISIGLPNSNGYVRYNGANTMAFTSTGVVVNANLSTTGAMGVGTSSPAATAALDVTSTAKGFLPPRMTTTQRDAIASPATGLMIFNTTNAGFEFYNGSAWSGVGIGIPNGTIAAFASASCPTGWSEYTAARGRFLRGIDNGAGVDPSGTRAPGNQQADAFQQHRHDMHGNYTNNETGSTYVAPTGSGWWYNNVDPHQAMGGATEAGSGSPRTSTETRPANVAVTFCIYIGSGGGGGATVLAGLSDVNITSPTNGQVLKYDTATSKWINGAASGGATPAGVDTQVQFNDGGAFGGDAGFAFNKTTKALTLGGATVTTSNPILNLSQIWNASGVTFTGMKLNITNTASAAGSLLADLQVGGVTQLKINKLGGIALPFTSDAVPDGAGEIGLHNGNGQLVFSAGGTHIAGIGTYGAYSGMTLGSTKALGWSPGGAVSGGNFVQDAAIKRRAAANIQFGLADAAAPVAQTLSVQNVVAGTTDTAGATFTIAGSQGTGTGTGGSLLFQTAPPGTTGTTQNALATALAITGSGNVGIGTTTPASQLHIASTTGHAGIRIEAPTGANFSYIDFFNNNVKKANIFWHNTGGYLDIGALSNASIILNAGGGAVAVGTNSPAATAQLDVSSTTKGFLPPRMTTTQRDAIASPATGLEIFNTTTGIPNFYNGTAWTAVGTGSGGTSSGTAGYVQLSGGSGAFTDSGTTAGQQFFWDNTNKRLGIGTATPSYPLDVQSAANLTSRIYSTGGSIATLQLRTASKAWSLSNQNDFIIYDETLGATRLRVSTTTGGVSIGTTTPNASAALDMQSTTQGLLPPRLTTTQRDAIATPATGLEIFNTTTGVPNFYNGTAWTAVGTGSGGTSSGTAGYVQLSGGSGAFADSGTTAGQQFFWDNTNKRLGIGTTSPSANLEVQVPAASGGVRVTQPNAGQDAFYSLNPTNSGGHEWRIAAADPTRGTYGANFVIRDQTLSAGRLVIDTAGNVGIGTAAPGSLLDVNGNASIRGTTYLGTSLAANLAADATNGYIRGTSGIAFQDAAATSTHSYLNTSGGNSYINGVSGNIGIGTTAPIRKLTLSDSASTEFVIQATGAPANQRNGRIRVDDNGKFYIGKLSDTGSVGTDQFALDMTTGNVGIGTASPSTRLHVQGGGLTVSADATSNSLITLGDSGSSGRTYVLSPGAGTGDRSYLNLYDGTAGAVRLAIGSTGNVGIGTASPGARLHVYSTGDNRVIVDSNDTTASNYTGYDIRGAGVFKGGLFVENNDKTKLSLWNASTKVITVDGSGNVGIGTASPTLQLLQVNGKIATNPASGWSGLDMYVNGGNRVTAYNSGTGDFVVDTSGTARMLINTSGNVGIGTTSPSQKLEIVDTVASSYVRLVSPLAQQSGMILADATNGTDWHLYRVDGSRDFSIWNPTVGNVVRITQAGNVGIGTASPIRTLHVNSAASEAAIVISRADSAVNSKNWRLYAQNSGAGTASSLTFDLMNDAGSGVVTQAITMANTGYVGIGTYNPGYQLDVQSGTYAVSGYTTGSTGQVGVYGRASSTGSHAALFHNTGSNYYCYIGYLNSYSIICSGPGSIPSDERLKKDVTSLDDSALDSLMMLRPVSYHWKDEKKGTRLEYGFIAQEVEKVLPNLVGEVKPTTDAEKAESGGGMLKTMQYEGLISPLVKAVQELKAANDNLKADNDNLRTELHQTIESQDKQLEEMRREIQELKAANSR